MYKKISVNRANLTPSGLVRSLATNDLTSALQLNSQAGWQPSRFTLTLDNDVIALSYPSPRVGPDSLFTAPISPPFVSGKRYFLGFDTLAERGAWMLIQGLLNVNDATTSEWNDLSFYDSKQWKFVGVTFEVPDPSKPVQLVFRFDVNHSSHRAYFKDFVLYELSDYNFYFRVQLLAPDRNPIPNQATAEAVLEVASTDHVLTTGGFPPLFTGLWTDWLELTPAVATGNAGRIKFRDLTTMVELQLVKAVFEVAVGPKGGKGDDARSFFYGVTSTEHGHAVVFLPTTVSSLLQLGNVRFLTDIIQQDIANAEKMGIPKVKQPQNLWIGCFFPHDKFYYDTFSDYAELLILFSKLGLNALDDGLTLDQATFISSLGFSGGVYYWRVLGDSDIFQQVVLPYKLTDIKRELARKAANWHGAPNGNDLATLFASAAERVVISANDEPAGLEFAGPDYDDAFHNYLQELSTNTDLVPADFGVASFNQLAPLPRTRPGSPTLVDGRIFYWRLRFWNEANVEVYRIYHEVARTNPHWGGPYHFTFNYGDPMTTTMTYANGMEVLTFAKREAVSIVWVGVGDTSTLVDYNNSFGLFMTTQQYMGLVADYCLAITRSAHVPIGTYLRTGDGRLRRLDYYLLTWASRGVAYFDYYGYGPGPIYDGHGGLNETTITIFEQMAHGNDLLAKAELILVGGTRPKAHIAMLAAQTEPLWEGPGTLEFGAIGVDDSGIHHALADGQYPIDYLFEKDIAAGTLNNDYKLLYLNVTYLRDDAFQAVLQWVNRGGVLLLGMHGATHNEYAQLVEPSRINVTLGPIQQGARQVNWTSVAVPINLDHPNWPTRALSGPGTILATYNTGENAAVEINQGVGKIIVIGFELGKAYLHMPIQPGSAFPGFFQTVFQEAVREILVTLAKDLGLDSQRPVWTNNPLVEAARINQLTRGAIVLLNYNNEPVHNLRVMIPGVYNWITSLGQQASLPVTQDATNSDVGVVELSLTDIDILTWASPSLQKIA